MITVIETADWTAFRSAVNNPTLEYQPGRLLFLVKKEGEVVGGLGVIGKMCGYELHTELSEKCRGADVAIVFAELRRDLVQRGIRRLSTYVKKENKPAAFMAAHVGFQRLACINDTIHFEVVL